MGTRKVAQLIVRNIDEDLVRLLRLRAAQNRRSAEAEHREILRQALLGEVDAASFDAFLLEIPNVGEDRDFERVRDKGRKVAL
ncbi:MAG TPA: DNA-binding protein [Vicinamibacteria bacterium]|jgi:plasmid stability protein